MVMDVNASSKSIPKFWLHISFLSKNSKHNTLTEYFNFPRISDNSLKLALTLNIMNS